MKLNFSKYQGTGNDFVMVDNRSGKWNELSVSSIQSICDRKFGIGADGLIKINTHSEFDFEVDYYNSDGSKSFCGNGARCSVAFAHTLGFTNPTVRFNAIDGAHSASKENDLVHLEMLPVLAVWKDGNAFVLNTGSPHYVAFTNELQELDVVEAGRSIRYNNTYKQEGINVNFIQMNDETDFSIRTYERGVEFETLSCGTGLTAAALVVSIEKGLFGQQYITARTQGGICRVSFNRTGEQSFENVCLIGPAAFIFNGEIDVNL